MRITLPAALQKFDLADLTGVAVLAGLAFAFVAGVVAPLALRDRLASGAAEQAIQDARHAAALTAGLRAATDDVAAVRQRIDAAPLRIRPTTALNERLAAAVALANECGLAVGDLKPGEPVRGKRFVTTPVRLGGSGGFGGVSRLLHRLSARMPDMAVAGFKLSAPAAGEAAGRYTLELRWLAAAEPATALAGATP